MEEQTERLTESESGQTPRRTPTTGYRSRELYWRQAHGEVLRNYSGQWIVLEAEEIVSHGTDPQRVVTQARAKGIRVPYIFYVGKAAAMNPVTLEW